MSTDRFCINCVHLRRFEHGVGLEQFRFARCDRTKRLDPVTGLNEYQSCANERDGLGSCGPAGKHFLAAPLPLREQLERSLAATVQ